MNGREVGVSIRRSFAVQTSLLALVAGLAVLGQAQLAAPPRYDGAGYAVLARSLGEGSGYRAIDHPDRPRHAHFPPGYPAALAALWGLTGESVVAAHVLSCVLTIDATILAWLWFRRIYAREVALILALSLAVNWNWSRTGSAIQSEPLFEFLGQLAVLAAAGAATSRSARGVIVGILLGACLLTRHIAVGLALAVLADFCLRGRWRSALVIISTVLGLITPWLIWLSFVGRQERTQAALLAGGEGSLASRLASQALFYMQRIPDQITGPLVEVATLLRPTPPLPLLGNLWGLVGTAVVLAGCVQALRRPRSRLTGLVILLTLALLLLWPYTEAGRFLIPLIPFLLVATVEGLGILFLAARRLAGSGRIRGRRLSRLAAILVLAVSVPFTAYAIVTHRGRRADATDQAFEAACAWLREPGRRAGPMLTRHPGEVFLATGRTALEVSSAERRGDRDAEPGAIADLIDRYRVAYVLVDDDRYLQAHPSPLRRFLETDPGRLRQVGAWEAGRSSIVLYEVVRGP